MITNNYFKNWMRYHENLINQLDILKGDLEISNFYKNSYHLKDFDEQSNRVFNEISTLIEKKLSSLKTDE